MHWLVIKVYAKVHNKDHQVLCAEQPIEVVACMPSMVSFTDAFSTPIRLGERVDAKQLHVQDSRKMLVSYTSEVAVRLTLDLPELRVEWE
ncbi:hypothetical protein EON64_17625, partial [archaeon]